MLSYLSLLLAVTTLAQDAPTPKAAPRAKRYPVIAMPAPDVQALVAPLAALEVDLEVLTANAQTVAMSAEALTAPAMALSATPMALLGPAFALTIGDDDDGELEPRWQNQSQADAADSVYRAARQALNRNEYQRAAQLFKSIRNRYARSAYVPNTYYWEAFALYRMGSDDNLRAARTALQTQAKQYPKASTQRDAQVLLRRVQGELARRGDREAAESLSVDVDEMSPATPVVAAVPPVGAAPASPPRGRPGRPSKGRDDACDDEDDIRIAALNAVLQMDADRAVPLLKNVLDRRDEGSACLRRKAVFLLSQKRTDETTSLLLKVVRQDPDQEVREQAVFWLSQVPGDDVVAALDSILQDQKTDPQIQEKAIFALSQHRSPRAAAILCSYAGRRDRPSDLREKAIFWIGQRRSDDNAQCLRNLYKTLENDDLKEKVIFSVAQMGTSDSYRWLMDIALNQNENIELRKKALFWAGQGRSAEIEDLVRLYDSMKDREMREQLIFVYSQRREEAAVDKLCQIGKTDPDRELRKKAIFWLGQSRSPKAGQCLQELINQ